MATGVRKRYNFEKGDLASLTGTTITFDVAPGFATLAAGEYIPLVIAEGGLREIVHLTSYTAAATTGTVERAQEGTTEKTFTAAAKWRHGLTVADLSSGGNSSLVAVASINPATQVSRSTTLATFSDIDASAQITFTVPASGKVLIRGAVSTYVSAAGAGNGQMNLRDTGVDVVGTNQMVEAYNGRVHYAALVEGLTPGAVETYHLGFATDGGTMNVRWGGATAGNLLLEVWDADPVASVAGDHAHAPLGRATYRAAADGSLSTTSATFVDVEPGGGLDVTFTAPASGSILWTLAGALHTSGSQGYVQLHNVGAAAAVADSSQMLGGSAGAQGNPVILVEGLTPGQSYTFRPQFRLNSTGTIYFYSGPTYGRLIASVVPA